MWTGHIKYTVWSSYWKSQWTAWHINNWIGIISSTFMSYRSFHHISKGLTNIDLEWCSLSHETTAKACIFTALLIWQEWTTKGLIKAGRGFKSIALEVLPNRKQFTVEYYWLLFVAHPTQYWKTYCKCFWRKYFPVTNKGRKQNIYV